MASGYLLCSLAFTSLVSSFISFSTTVSLLSLPSFIFIHLRRILGDHPPRDRGGYLRKYSFAIRHLGPRQMSTDTAVLTAFTVFRHGCNLNRLRYIDDPEVYTDQIEQSDVNIKFYGRLTDNSNSGAKGGMRESTRIRMRYLSQYQPQLKHFPSLVEPTSSSSSSSPQTEETTTQPPSTSTTTDAYLGQVIQESGAERVLWPSSCFDLPKGTDSILGSLVADSAINNPVGFPGTHEKLPRKNTDKPVPGEFPAMTPGLLQHIFATMDEGLDGVLEIGKCRHRHT